MSRRPRVSRAQISRFQWATLFSEQGGRCAGCHRPLNSDAHIDHVVPLARGGADRFENLQLLHESCNLAKGDTPAPEWFERCWRTYRASLRKPTRESMTLSLDVELMERLRLAAYWSRRSISALIEDGAQQTVRAIEAKPWPGLVRSPKPVAMKGRWAALPVCATPSQNVLAPRPIGDLFGR